MNKVFDSISAKVKDTTGVKGWLARWSIKHKLKNYKKRGDIKHTLLDMLVFSKMRKALGGKVKYISSGSAPINADTLNFLRVCFSAVV